MQTRACKRKTLVLDLDETLVHSTLDGFDLPDFSFPVFFNNRCALPLLEVHGRTTPALVARKCDSTQDLFGVVQSLCFS